MAYKKNSFFNKAVLLIFSVFLICAAFIKNLPLINNEKTTLYNYAYDNLINNFNFDFNSPFVIYYFLAALAALCLLASLVLLFLGKRKYSRPVNNFIITFLLTALTACGAYIWFFELKLPLIDIFTSFFAYEVYICLLFLFVNNANRYIIKNLALLLSVAVLTGSLLFPFIKQGNLTVYGWQIFNYGKLTEEFSTVLLGDFIHRIIFTAFIYFILANALISVILLSCKNYRKFDFIRFTLMFLAAAYLITAPVYFLDSDIYGIFGLYIILIVSFGYFLAGIISIITLKLPGANKTKSQKQKAEKTKPAKEETEPAPAAEEKPAAEEVKTEESPVVAEETKTEEAPVTEEAKTEEVRTEEIPAVEITKAETGKADTVAETVTEQPLTEAATGQAPAEAEAPAEITAENAAERQQPSEEVKEEITEEKAEEPEAIPEFIPKYPDDLFLKRLNDELCDEFVDMFITEHDRYFRNLPPYIINDLNLLFFKKIFIFIGKYKNIISPELLDAIYKYLLIILS